MSLPGGATPGFYVARDRARRFARLLTQAIQDRRLAYRGDSIGLASLTNESVSLLETLLKEGEASVADVLAQRLRDRERGYLDVPFVVMSEGVLERARLALRLERARAGRHAPDAPTQQAVLDLLEDAVRRIDAFCAVYDEKRPVAQPRSTDLAHLLERVERHARLEREGRPPAFAAPSVEGPVPEVTTSGDALEDLLRAARACLPLAQGPWRVVRGQPGEPLALVLGARGNEDVAIEHPPRLERALRVLAHVHPATVRLVGRDQEPPAVPARRDWGAEPAAAPAPPGVTPAALDPIPTCVEVRLPDPAAGGTQLSAAAGAGSDARLTPEAEKAVRALLAAPPLPEHGAPSPQRTVALLGLLKAFDVEVTRVLMARLGHGDLKAAARELPREDTRKAPLRPDVLEALAPLCPGVPPGRIEDLVADVAAGKAGRKRCTALDLALLLALFGRTYVVGGFKAVQALPLAPWSEADVLASIADLLEVTSVRKALEGGQGVEASAMTRLERATVALLGRLGRLM